MGNSCGNGAYGRQRICLMERHTLSDEQMAKLEEMFKMAAKGKRYVSFKEFLSLYPADSNFQRDEADMRSVYCAFADANTNTLKFDGFVMLMLLSNRVGSVEEPQRMQALFNVMDSAGCRNIPRADFRRFARSFAAAEEEKPNATNADQTDTTDGVTADDALIGFDEFSEFCSAEKDTYGAICSYVFPM